MIVLYIIIGIVILNFILKLWDGLKGLLGVLVSVVSVVAFVTIVYVLYSLVNFHIWPILVVAIGLLAYDLKWLAQYRQEKSDVIIFLEDAIKEARAINSINGIEMENEIERQIADIMSIRGMGTDIEVFGDVDFQNIDNTNDRRRKLHEALSQRGIDTHNICSGVFDEAATLLDKMYIFKKGLRQLVDSNEVEVVADLNNPDTEDEKAESWDGKLYKATTENINPSAMLPTMFLSVD